MKPFKVIIVEDVKLELKGTEEILYPPSHTLRNRLRPRGWSHRRSQAGWYC